MQFVIVFGFSAVKSSNAPTTKNDLTLDFNSLLFTECLSDPGFPSTIKGKALLSQWPGVYRIGYFKEVAEDKQFKFASEIVSDLLGNFQACDSEPMVMIVRCKDIRKDIIDKRQLEFGVFDSLNCIKENRNLQDAASYVQQIQFNKKAEVIFARKLGTKVDPGTFYLNAHITNDELTFIVAQFNPINFSNNVMKVTSYKLFVIKEHKIRIIADQQLSKETLSKSGMLQQVNLVKELTRAVGQANKAESESIESTLNSPVIQRPTPVKAQEQSNPEFSLPPQRPEIPRPCNAPVKKPFPIEMPPERPHSIYPKLQP